MNITNNTPAVMKVLRLNLHWTLQFLNIHSLLFGLTQTCDQKKYQQLTQIISIYQIPFIRKFVVTQNLFFGYPYCKLISMVLLQMSIHLFRPQFCEYVLLDTNWNVHLMSSRRHKCTWQPTDDEKSHQIYLECVSKKIGRTFSS